MMPGIFAGRLDVACRFAVPDVPKQPILQKRIRVRRRRELDYFPDGRPKQLFPVVRLNGDRQVELDEEREERVVIAPRPRAFGP